MNRASVIRAAVTAFSGVFAVAALAAIAAEMGTDPSRAHSAVSAEWIAPVIAGVAAGALAWLVLDRPPVEIAQPEREMFTCPSCSSTMLDGWRLCPHCGALLEQSMPQPAVSSFDNAQGKVHPAGVGAERSPFGGWQG